MKTHARHAFTLVEVIVVVALLAIIAGFVTPRLTRQTDVPARDTAELVRVFLSAVAARDAATSTPLAIKFDADAGKLGLLMENDDPSVREFWKRDVMVSRVDLSAVSITRATADSGHLGTDGWRFELAQAERRALIELEVESRSSGASWTVWLEPFALRAVAMRTGDTVSNPSVLDLDDNARGQWVW